MDCRSCSDLDSAGIDTGILEGRRDGIGSDLSVSDRDRQAVDRQILRGSCLVER